MVRVALAHLRSITIHPFDDGNGRIASMLMLARSQRSSPIAFAPSAEILHRRGEYYEQLEQAQRGGLDVTPWMIWSLTVLASAVGARLHPALGIHHQNRYNPLCLADDAIDLLRPMVDVEVWRLMSEGSLDVGLNPATRRRLLGVLGGFVHLAGQRFPLLTALERHAANLRRAICEGESLVPPTPIYPA